MKKKNGFTLIELIAVLVILAILALIVTPLVMNIIRKARISADKRSIDTYGRSIELAIAGYLLDNGKFPTEVSQLTIEYSGNKVECETTQINSDSSVYLAGCTVAGRSVDYTYGTDKNPIVYDAYEVGDEVTYNNINYYVIKDSNELEESVMLLKAEPLSVEEVNTYGTGHVNRYTADSIGTAYDKNGYGEMAYYSSETCGFPNGGNSSTVETGCTTDYEQSEVKYAIDTWKAAQAPAATEARLIKIDDLVENLGYSIENICSAGQCRMIQSHVDAPTWVYNYPYYWTMSQYSDSSFIVWLMGYNGELVISAGQQNVSVYDNFLVVRPVIVLPKSALN